MNLADGIREWLILTMADHLFNLILKLLCEPKPESQGQAPKWRIPYQQCWRWQHRLSKARRLVTGTLSWSPYVKRTALRLPRVLAIRADGGKLLPYPVHSLLFLSWLFPLRFTAAAIRCVYSFHAVLFRICSAGGSQDWRGQHTSFRLGLFRVISL